MLHNDYIYIVIITYYNRHCTPAVGLTIHSP